jgi:hypothetical protein
LLQARDECSGIGIYVIATDFTVFDGEHIHHAAVDPVPGCLVFPGSFTLVNNPVLSSGAGNNPDLDDVQVILEYGKELVEAILTVEFPRPGELVFLGMIGDHDAIRQQLVKLIQIPVFEMNIVVIDDLFN